MIIKYISSRPIIVVLCLCIIILFTLPFHIKIDSLRKDTGHIDHVSYLNSSILKRISLGFDELMADIYWIRALQYFGTDDLKTSQKDSNLLYKYLDIITDLDPKFINAYRYGGTFLAEPPPIGMGDIDNGMLLMDKGRENNPENYRIPLEQAFIYYIYERNYEKAAELFDEASEKPGLSDFRKASIKGMAGTSLIKGGQRELSMQIWKEIYESTLSQKRRSFALRQLNEINTQNMEDKLTSLSLKYENEYGQFPTDINNLLIPGYLKKVPADHGGKEFIIIPRIKQVKSRTLLENQLSENLRIISAKGNRYHALYGIYPKDLGELRRFIETETTLVYPENPLEENYSYDPDTGKVHYDIGYLFD